MKVRNSFILHFCVYIYIYTYIKLSSQSALVGVYNNNPKTNNENEYFLKGQLETNSLIYHITNHNKNLNNEKEINKPSLNLNNDKERNFQLKHGQESLNSSESRYENEKVRFRFTQYEFNKYKVNRNSNNQHYNKTQPYAGNDTNNYKNRILPKYKLITTNCAYNSRNQVMNIYYFKNNKPRIVPDPEFIDRIVVQEEILNFLEIFYYFTKNEIKLKKELHIFTMYFFRFTSDIIYIIRGFDYVNFNISSQKFYSLVLNYKKNKTAGRSIDNNNKNNHFINRSKFIFIEKMSKVIDNFKTLIGVFNTVVTDYMVSKDKPDHFTYNEIILLFKVLNDHDILFENDTLCSCAVSLKEFYNRNMRIFKSLIFYNEYSMILEEQYENEIENTEQLQNYKDYHLFDKEYIEWLLPFNFIHNVDISSFYFEKSSETQNIEIKTYKTNEPVNKIIKEEDFIQHFNSKLDVFEQLLIDYFDLAINTLYSSKIKSI